MNWLPIFITIILASYSTTITAEEPNGALFKWPSFTNTHHGSGNLIKRVQCGASIHSVYSCLRSTLLKIPATHQQHSLMHAATDCCANIANFRGSCGDLKVGKLESLIFPALLFKQCPGAGDTSAPAPDTAAGPAADIEV